MFKFGFDLTPCAPEVAKAFESGNYEEAGRLARVDVDNARNAKDKVSEGKSLCAYVKALLAGSDVWNARKAAEDALDVARSCPDKLLKAEAMHAMAKVNVKDSVERRNDPNDKSERSRTKKEFVNRRGTGEDENSPAADTVAAWNALKPAAAFCAEKAKTYYKEAGSAEGEISVELTLSAISLKGKKLGVAQNMADSAIKQFRQKTSKLGEAAALYQLYLVQSRDESPEEAVQTLDEIEACFDENSPSDSSSIGAASLLTSELKFGLNEYTEAANRSSKAAEFFHSASDGNNKASALLMLAKSLKALGEADDADQAVDAAIDHFKAAHNKKGQAQGLELSADLLMKKGRQKYESVIFTLKEAAFLYRQIKDVYNEGLVLNAVSKLELQAAEAGDGNAGTEALRHAERAIYLFDDSWKVDTHENAEANMTAAKMQIMMKDGEDALAKAKECLRIMQQLGNRSGEGYALNTLAEVCYMSKSQYSQGDEYLAEARDIATNLDDGNLLKDLVVSPAEKKAAGGGNQVQKTHIDILWGSPAGMVKIAKFFEFQARVASYSQAAMTGGDAKAGADGAILDSTFSGPGAQKVDYAIRWQKIKEKELDLKKMAELAA